MDKLDEYSRADIFGVFGGDRRRLEWDIVRRLFEKARMPRVMRGNANGNWEFSYVVMRGLVVDCVI